MSTYRRLLAVLLLVGVLAPSLVAQQKLAQQIVGRWRPVEQDKTKIIVEFTKAGRLFVHVEDKQIQGTFQVLDDAHIEVSLQVEDKTLTEKLRVSIQGDELTTVDSKGKKDTFRRIK